jgi:hypothetical protein
MVDAQAPGLANMIRSLSDINYFKEGWQTGFIDQLSRIYLVISGYKNIGTLHAGLQHDIKTWVGFTQNQDELKEQTGITDTWLVLSKQTKEEDTITVERNWLFGINSKQYALVLQFIFRGQGGQLVLTPGLFIEAELVFFPSASPLRAIIKKQTNTGATQTVNSFANWQEVAAAETNTSALQPFRSERPYIINQLTPVNYNGQWHLQDAQQEIMPVQPGFAGIWKLLSLSGGEALNMAVIGKEKIFEPTGVWHNNEYKPL